MLYRKVVWWYRGPDFLSQPMRNPGSQGLKTTNFPNLRSNQDRDLDLPVTSQSVLHPSETSVPLAVFPGPGCEGSHCPGPQLSSGFISDHGHSLPPGRAAPSGCSCYQQESDDCPALTFPDWSGDTNSHNQSWKSVRKFHKWKPVQPKGNHILLYDGIGNFIKNKISKQKEQ